MHKTSAQYDSIITTCRQVFEKKNLDYGTSWRIMRLSSIIDQIYIKAARIRTIEEKGSMKIDEGIGSEFMGIVNYCIMGMIQMELKDESEIELEAKQVLTMYDKYVHETKNLMEQKNHDYGEAWRDMLLSTYTDMLLMRIHRIRQIMDNKGKTIASEGIASNLMDMINYSLFALIRMSEDATDAQMRK